MLRKWILVWTVFAMVMLSGQARALTLDFEGFTHGEIVSTPNTANYKGVILTVENFNNAAGHPDVGIAFDSEDEVNTRDPDLERGKGWAAGNIAPSTMLNNILVIQENDTGCSDGICDLPDDEGRRQAGTITLDYSNLAVTFSFFQFDLIDVDDVVAELGMIEFKFQGGSIASFDFADFGVDFGAVFGDRSANRIDLGEVGLFDEVVVTLGGSGGIDNIITTVPEPSTLVLSILGMAGLTVVGRRRR